VPVLLFFVFVVLVVLVTLALGYGLSSVEQRATSRRCRRPYEMHLRRNLRRQRVRAGSRSLAERELRHLSLFTEQSLLAPVFSLSMYGVNTYIQLDATTTRRFSIVATTTENVEKMGKTAEAIARTTQRSAYTAMDYAVKAQEVNTELLRKTTEVWIEGFRKQTELSQDMTREFVEKAEEQAHAYRDFMGQWGFPFASLPFARVPYDPFGFWREWAQDVQQSARENQRTVLGAQKETAEETARVIETTAPTNGSLLIAGYDDKSVGEITARLDTLTADQLERLKDYERRNKNRETLIREIERRTRSAS
jgi:hypothetical protein